MADREIRIDLSNAEPGVYVDGVWVGHMIDITYAKPPASPLTIERVNLRIKPKATSEGKRSRQVQEEIEEAQTATPTPRHWRPVEIDEEFLR
jgi:hypothetical protein